MKTLLILENDFEITKSYHPFVWNFKENFDGEVIELTGLRQRSDAEIFTAVNKCNIIAVQTCFVNGSDDQLFSMLTLLSKIKESKDIYIYLMGGDLNTYLLRNLEDADFFKIKHHNIFKMGDKRYDSILEDNILLDFSIQINTHIEIIRLAEEKRIFELHYTSTSNTRPTGRKIKILGCTALGEQFKNLIPGEIVNEVDMSVIDPNNKRGVWIYGKTEAIKLVNDCGMLEYQIASELDLITILREISNCTNINTEKLTEIEIRGISNLLNDEDYDSHEKANILCDALNVPRRGNRINLERLIETI